MRFIDHYFSRKIPAILLLVSCTLFTACSFIPERSEKQDAPISQAFSQASDSPDEAVAVSDNPYLADRANVSWTVEKSFKAAIDLLKQQQWSQAEQQLISLTENYPQYSGPWLNLAYLYHETDRNQEAEEAYQKAINANPRNINAYNELAILFREQGRFIESEQLYIQALSTWNDHPATHLNLAILYDLYMGRMDDALHHYRQYQSLQSEEDHKVKAWIADLQRRINRLVAENHHDD